MSDLRIVSLIASGTEIVAALGFEEALVGRSHECDFPSTVERLPVCSEPKIDVNGTSLQIDERVKDVLREAVSVYRVDGEMLDQLRPTTVITQTQCEVCAVSLKDVEAAVCDMVTSQPKIVPLEPNNLEDVWNDIRLVGEALQATKRAERLIDTSQQRLGKLAADTSALAQRPTIACIEWIEPMMVAGNWVPELVEFAGGNDVLGKAGEHSPYIDWEKLLQADPEVIALMPCGFDISRTRRELPALTDHPNWTKLQAVQSGRVFVTDGNQYFNRPGPRLVESAEILAEILHPGRFDFGHRGRGWETL